MTIHDIPLVAIAIFVISVFSKMQCYFLLQNTIVATQLVLLYTNTGGTIVRFVFEAVNCPALL